MKIVVSKAYTKWKNANKSDRTSDAVDRFLCRVFQAADITQVAPQPKAVGGNLRKMPGTVNEFTLARNYRVYSKCVELTPGEFSFCLATVGTKGRTNQNEDILMALSIFDDMEIAGWKSWTPTAEQIASYSVADEAPVASDNVTETVPAKPKKQNNKKKGKPLDENGLTVAERKALRKKQQQEEINKRRQEAQKAKQAQMAEAVAKTNKADVTPAPVVDVIVPASVPVASDNVAPDTASAPVVVDVVPSAPVADDVAPADVQPKVTDVTPADTDISDDQIRVVTPKSEAPHGDITFTDYADVQYNLELIEHQMAIEKLKIKISQHEMALEELAIKKLKLMHMQKQNAPQK